MNEQLRIEFNLRLPEDAQPKARRHFEELEALAGEIKEAREAMLVKICEQKFRSAAVQASLIAELLRRLDDESVKFRDAVRPMISDDAEVYETNFYAQL